MNKEISKTSFTAYSTGMEIVIAIALGSLAALFVGASLILLILCRRQYCYYNKKDSSDLSSDLLNDDTFDLSDILEGDEWISNAGRWVDDATGLAPPCIAVLRSCHSLTANLTAIAGNINSNAVPLEVIDLARRIPPRVDDVVRSLYPPLDARLLEARVAALVSAVTHLTFVTKHGISEKQMKKLTFIDQTLRDMDLHLLVLRNAALAQENMNVIPASTPV